MSPRPDPRCPLRPGEPCTLCQAFVTGPHDCGLVYLVMDDPELREQWVEHGRAQRAKATLHDEQEHPSRRP